MMPCMLIVQYQCHARAWLTLASKGALTCPTLPLLLCTCCPHQLAATRHPSCLGPAQQHAPQPPAASFPASMRGTRTACSACRGTAITCHLEYNHATEGGAGEGGNQGTGEGEGEGERQPVNQGGGSQVTGGNKGSQQKGGRAVLMPNDASCTTLDPDHHMFWCHGPFPFKLCPPLIYIQDWVMKGPPAYLSVSASCASTSRNALSALSALCSARSSCRLSSANLRSASSTWLSRLPTCLE